MKLSFVAWLLMSCSIFGACTSSDGDATTDSGAANTEAGSDAGDCPGGDTSTVNIVVTGLPSDAEAVIGLSGPDGETSANEGSNSDLPTGRYGVTAERVTDTDPIVRGLYDPTIDMDSFCLGGREVTITVDYELVPPSNKLWVLNDVADASLLAFASANLTESGSPSGIAANAVAGGDVTFDRDGNLWTFGPTTEDPPLVRYEARTLGESGDKEADRMLDVGGVECIPGLRAMAFDGSGNLWVSVCGGKVVRLTTEHLERGDAMVETVMPDVVMSGLTENGDVAFDSEGNLWVTDEGKAVRFDESRLASSDSDPPDAAFSVRNASDTQDIGVDFLTFDAEGNLWATDFGGNFVAQVDKTDLSGSDTDPLVARVSLVLSVSALLDRPAFDESGGLWISYSANKVARIAPDDLLVSTDAGSPTVPAVVLEGGDIGNTGNVAFFPAPAGLPLFHAYP